jgi:hypothetical protein
MVKTKGTKRQPMIYTTQKTKYWEHEHHKKVGVTSGDPVQLVVPVVSLLNDTNIMCDMDKEKCMSL